VWTDEYPYDDDDRAYNAQVDRERFLADLEEKENGEAADPEESYWDYLGWIGSRNPSLR
jgi:hypothetical protein